MADTKSPQRRSANHKRTQSNASSSYRVPVPPLIPTTTATTKDPFSLRSIAHPRPRPGQECEEEEDVTEAAKTPWLHNTQINLGSIAENLPASPTRKHGYSLKHERTQSSLAVLAVRTVELRPRRTSVLSADSPASEIATPSLVEEDDLPAVSPTAVAETRCNLSPAQSVASGASVQFLQTSPGCVIPVGAATVGPEGASISREQNISANPNNVSATKPPKSTGDIIGPVPGTNARSSKLRKSRPGTPFPSSSYNPPQANTSVVDFAWIATFLGFLGTLAYGYYKAAVGWMKARRAQAREARFSRRFSVFAGGRGLEIEREGRKPMGALGDSMRAVKSPVKAGGEGDRAYGNVIGIGVGMTKVDCAGGLEVEYGVAKGEGGVGITYQIWQSVSPLHKPVGADILYIHESPLPESLPPFAISLLHGGYRLIIPDLRTSDPHPLTPQPMNVTQMTRHAAEVLREVRRKDILELTAREERSKAVAAAIAKGFDEEEELALEGGLTESERIKLAAGGYGPVASQVVAKLLGKIEPVMARVESTEFAIVNPTHTKRASLTSLNLSGSRSEGGPHRPTFIVGLGHGALVALSYPIENVSNPLPAIHGYSPSSVSFPSMAFSTKVEPNDSVLSRLGSIMFWREGRGKKKEEEGKVVTLLPVTVNGIIAIGLSLDPNRFEKRRSALSMLSCKSESKRMSGIGPTAYLPSIKSAIENLRLNARRIRLPVMLIHGTKETYACTAGINGLYESFASPDCTIIFSPSLSHAPARIATDAFESGSATEAMDWMGERLARGKVRFSSQGVRLAQPPMRPSIDTRAIAPGITEVDCEEEDIVHITNRLEPLEDEDRDDFSRENDVPNISTASRTRTSRMSSETSSLHSALSQPCIPVDTTVMVTTTPASIAVNPAATTPIYDPDAEEPIEELAEHDPDTRRESLIGLGISFLTRSPASSIHSFRTSTAGRPTHSRTTSEIGFGDGENSEAGETWESAGDGEASSVASTPMVRTPVGAYFDTAVGGGGGTKSDKGVGMQPLARASVDSLCIAIPGGGLGLVF